jgi:hypothetical protein
MADRKRSDGVSLGVADHCGWAVFVTVDGEGRLVDRRRVELVDEALPKLPHHHDAQGLPVDEGVALVQRVARAAEVCAGSALKALAREVPGIAAIAMRACPTLPETIAERIADTWSQNRADSVMYRNALARAAERRGWLVHWYEERKVIGEAARALGRASIDDLLAKTGKTLGPPWTKDHRIAMAAAIAVRARGGGAASDRSRTS